MKDTPGIAFLESLHRELGVKVFTKVPMKRPNTFIRVDLGPGKNASPVAEQRLVAVQVYSTDVETVTDLVYKTRFYLMDRVYQDSPKVLWWEEESGPHEWPDPDLTSVFRWQITGNLTLTLT